MTRCTGLSAILFIRLPNLAPSPPCCSNKKRRHWPQPHCLPVCRGRPEASNNEQRISHGGFAVAACRGSDSQDFFLDSQDGFAPPQPIRCIL